LFSPGPPEEPKPEVKWSDEAPEVHHLLEDNWEEFMGAHSSALIMFYAPCKLDGNVGSFVFPEMQDSGLLDTD